MTDAIRILYVDDEPDQLSLTKLYLEKSGDFEVATALSAKEAIRVLGQEKFDAIISDYLMPPGMDGIQFLIEVRTHFGLIPFIFFTGRGKEEVVIQVLNAGADFYLQKGGEPGAMFAELSHNIRTAVSKKRAIDALRESEERYRNVVEDQTDFISRFLPGGTHLFVNDAYCRYFNKRREEIIGHKFIPVLHPDDREMVERQIASLAPEHPVVNIDQRIIMPDDSIRWQQWTDRAIFDPYGRVIEYQSVGRDITEQKEIENEMEYHEQELIKFSNSLDVATKKLNVLYGITRHDINNQLTVILGYLGMLECKVQDPTLDEYFKTLATAAQNITSMIQFTREYEDIGLNPPVWQDCRTLIDDAAKQVPLGQVMVKNDIPAGMAIYADPLVVKVCYNLMDNAVRYGGKITTIRLSVENYNGDHVVVCEDDGDGVIAQEKEQIFERGFGKNTGLGLALAREILSITGITLRETGEPGKGARFEMMVPKGAWRITDVQKEMV